MKTTSTIAERLITLCSAGEFIAALTELFADNASSIDPLNPDRNPKGLADIIAAEQSFLAAVTIHEIVISAPVIAGKYFSIRIYMDFTRNGNRVKIDEIGVYETTDGKIVSQQFFIGDMQRELAQ